MSPKSSDLLLEVGGLQLHVLRDERTYLSVGRRLLDVDITHCVELVLSRKVVWERAAMGLVLSRMRVKH